MPVRRGIVRAGIVSDILVLIAVAVGLHFVRHSLGETVFVIVLPSVSMLCGLAYLRSTRGQQ